MPLLSSIIYWSCKIPSGLALKPVLPQTKTMKARILSTLSVLLLTGPAIAVPHPTSELTTSAAVYLKPYAAIPTGHYNINLLKKNQIAQDQVRWVFVKNQLGQTGWALKHQLLNPLHFSTRARLLAKSPIFKDRREPRADTSLTPQAESTVTILDVQNEWVKISYENQNLWTTASHLFPIEKDAGYFFAKQDIILTETPRNKSRLVKKVSAGTRLTPLEVKESWMKVAIENKSGYVLSAKIMSRIDIASKVKTDKGYEPASRNLLGRKVFAIYIDPLWLGTGVKKVTLYQQPNTSSTILGQIPPWQNLTQQDTVIQKWAVSSIKELGGNVWWEMKSDGHDYELEQLTQLNLKDVRKILPNPAYNNLKIASANGLFRSTDGQYWSPLPQFQGHNPAFTFATDGILFVEDKMSMDNGEHFTPFIMWEKLLKSLRDNRLAVAQNLKILNIETLNSSSQQLILELDIGNRKTVKAYTGDRGQTWSILKI
jgi:SH3-like domain-containing protein